MKSVGPAVYEGFIEYLSKERVAGWAAQVGSNKPVAVQILLDGRILGRTLANIVRQDLLDSGRGDGAHAFEFYFPEPIIEGRISESVQIRIQDTDYKLLATESLLYALQDAPGSATSNISDLLLSELGLGTIDHSAKSNNLIEQSIKSQVVDKLPRSETSTLASGETTTLLKQGYKGAFVAVHDQNVVGWAKLDDVNAALLITIDGKVVGETSASGISVDGADAFLTRHGFSISVSPTILTGAYRKVALYDGVSGARVPVPEDKLWFPLFEKRAVKTASGAVPKAAPGAGPPVVNRKLELPEPALTNNTTITPRPERRKVAVVAWDMAHNPVGRAFLLADLAAADCDVELVGPTFAFYGGRIWPPIADTAIAMRSFPATDMQSLVAGAVELARTTRCDIVVVGKPRLSSLLIGALIRQANDCPMIVDIDDHELSFVKNQTPASYDDLIGELAKDETAANTPYSDIWTRFAETLVSEADSIIVSNVALRNRFGGMIVRHARNEQFFDPALYDRDKIRAEFGYNDADRVILFLGTPRAHKGIFEIADALERLNDPRLALCIIGSVTDKRMLARFSSYKNARITLHPDQPWARLPELVNLADQAAILQDPSHPIAEFQIPAKLTDSLALDVPVLATLVPPLADLAHANVFEIVQTPDELDAALVRLAESAPRSATLGRGREAFLTEFSYTVNTARLNLAFAAAKRSRKSEFKAFERLFRLLEQRTEILLPRLVDTPPRLDRRAPILAGDRARDLVFLWKQNDSDIYGRRSDMIAKYLLSTERVRRVIHLDAPLSATDLERQATHSDGDSAHQGNLVYVNTVRRILKTADTANFIRRTYLYRSGSRPERALGRDLPTRDAYPDFIRKLFRECGVREAPILWVSPIVFDYQAIADIAKPSFIVADIIDDQRTFPGDSEAHRQRVSGAYSTILREADAVFSNCVPVRDAFASLRPDIAMVPNGAELLPDVESWKTPVEIDRLPRPVIGYVGNLRDRIDLDLVAAVAQRFPEGTVALIGSAHGRPEVAALAAKMPNIKLLGVRPYEEAQRMMRGFDVAIMPHLKNEQSDRMNPLKLYVYFSVGVPVVTTEVANIGDLAPYVNVAMDEQSFLEAIESVLAGSGKVVSDDQRHRVLGDLSWESRVAEIWRHLESVA